MRRIMTARDCMYRACRLMVMADSAESYKDILVYEQLAQEWLTMAGRAAACEERSPLPDRPEAVAAAARTTPTQRFRWWGLKSWFQ